MAKKKLTIGYITPNLVDGIGAELWRGINDALTGNGHNLITIVSGRFNSQDPEDRARTVVYEYLNQDNFDGYIIWASSIFCFDNDKDLNKIFVNKNNKPVINLQLEIKNYSFIVHDNYKSMKEILDHLINHHKYKKIGFVRGPDTHNLAQIRYQAFMDALKEHGLEYNEKLVSAPGNWQEYRGNDYIVNLISNFKLDPVNDLDAVVCSNAHMAKGVIKELKSLGIKVPNEVAVTGFNDDLESNYMTPSITTIDPNFYDLGKLGIESLIKIIQGNLFSQKIEKVIIPAKIIIRNSCGCLDQTILELIDMDKNTKISENEFLTDYKDSILKSILNTFQEISGSAYLIKKLVSTIIDEIENSSGINFYFLFKELLQELIIENVSSSVIQKVIYEINSYLFKTLTDKEKLTKISKLTHQLLIMVYQNEYKHKKFEQIKKDELEILLNLFGQKLVTNFKLSNLVNILIQELPNFQIDYTSLYLYEDESRKKVKKFFSFNEEEETVEEIINSNDIFSKKHLPKENAYSVIAYPLYFELEQLGFIVFKKGDIPIKSYQDFQGQLNSCLKGAYLIREREGLLGSLNDKNLELNKALESLWGEMELAKKIQTSILPKEHNIPGYELTPYMKPASLVGGDYYDIVQAKNGSYWINIGDATGHGVTAGLIMLMLQTSLTTIILNDNEIQPKDLIIQANKIMYYNLKTRLMLDHFVTTCFIKFDKEGNFTFAGAHLDILIYRSISKKVEVLPTRGIWIGMLENIEEHIENSDFKLGKNDVMILYTDGVIESINSNGEQYDLKRLHAFLKKNGDLTTDEISQKLNQELELFQKEQLDDFTYIVLKKE